MYENVSQRDWDINSKQVKQFSCFFFLLDESQPFVPQDLSKSFPSVLPKVEPNYQLIYHSPAHHKNQTKHAPIYQRKKSNSPLAAQHSRHVDTKPRNSGL